MPNDEPPRRIEHVPERWWMIITASGGPLIYGGGAVVLFPAEDVARQWMSATDIGVRIWDGVAPGSPALGDVDK